MIGTHPLLSVYQSLFFNESHFGKSSSHEDFLTVKPTHGVGEVALAGERALSTHKRSSVGCGYWLPMDPMLSEPKIGTHTGLVLLFYQKCI